MLERDQRHGAGSPRARRAHLLVGGQQVGVRDPLGVARQRLPALARAAAAEQRLDAAVEIRVQRVDQHHALHLAGVLGGEQLRVHAAERRAREHVRRLDAGLPEQGVQLRGHRRAGARLGPGSDAAIPARS